LTADIDLELFLDIIKEV